MKLSERLRPEVECAPWVVEDVRQLETELERFRADAAALYESTGDYYNTCTCNRAEVDAINRAAYTALREHEKLVGR